MTDSPNKPNPAQQFISEPIEPEKGSFDPQLMTMGLASLPGAFVWRGRRYAIVECLEHRKVSGPEEGNTAGERYLRRQEFRVRLDSGQLARLYVLRHAPAGVSRNAAKKRWFLYTITAGPMDDEGDGS